MADNDNNNDEYKFSELDSHDNEDSYSGSNKALTSDDAALERTSVMRNALIVLGIVVLAMVLYKFGGALFTRTKTTEPPKNAIPSIGQTTPQSQIPPRTQITSQPIETAPAPAPSVEPAPVNLPVQQVEVRSDTVLNDRVAGLEQSQQNTTSQVSSLSQQVITLNNNMSNLNTKITSLDQAITNLATQMAKQSEEISVLIVRSQPKKPKVHVHHVITKPVIYHIQAVIPGRAWLIASNGSTLTVREGIKVAGYGTINLIDSIQGRILTSSGRIIRFSQQDS